MDFRLRGIEPRHLPVPAGQRQIEQRLADRLRNLVAALLGGRHVGNQRAQIDVEPAVERALDRVAVDRRKRDAGDDEDHDGKPVAQRNSRNASELARIGRSEQITEAAYRLDHVNAELFADTSDKHFNRV